MRTTYLMVTFWGEEFREHFYNLLLPSLLTPGNLPSLDATLLISTTKEDWASLADRPFVRGIPRAEVIYIDGPGAQPFQHYVAGTHLDMARRVHAEGAVAGFLMPDMVISDRLLGDAYAAIAAGRAVVLAPALRYSMEKVLARIFHPDDYSARALAEIASQSLHPEISRYNYGGDRFANYPIWVYWPVSHHQGFILHTVSWALVLADYGAVSGFKDFSLRRDTIDGSYVGENFGHLKRSQIELFADSDQGVVMGLTSEHDPRFSTRQRRIWRAVDALGWKRERQHWAIRRFPKREEIDPWRAWLYTQPAVIHGDDRDEVYESYLRHAAEIMEPLVGGAAWVRR